MTEKEKSCGSIGHWLIINRLKSHSNHFYLDILCWRKSLWRSVYCIFNNDDCSCYMFWFCTAADDDRHTWYS